MRAFGVVSQLVLPVTPGARCKGGLSLVNRSGPRTWSPEHVQRLRLVAEVLASALARKETEDALRASETMKSAILSSLNSGVAVLDRSGRIIAVNEEWARLGGRRRRARRRGSGWG